MYQISCYEFAYLASWARWIGLAHFGRRSFAERERPWEIEDAEDFIAGSLHMGAALASTSYRSASGTPFFLWASQKVYWEMKGLHRRACRRNAICRIETMETASLEEAAPTPASAAMGIELDTYLAHAGADLARRLLYARYAEGQTQGQAARALGLAQPRAAQIEAEALRRLRKGLGFRRKRRRRHPARRSRTRQTAWGRG